MQNEIMWHRETHSSRARSAHANKAAGANPQSNADRDAWNRAFHGKMNDLARPLTSGRSSAAHKSC